MAELSGLEIILTRPQAQAALWAPRLRELGAKVELASMMEIVPVDTEAQVRAIKNCVLDLDLYQKVIFVSQNAVVYGFEWIDNYWPQLPVKVDFLAVGEATANMLQGYGAAVTDLAQSQHGAMTSETLLQSPTLQQVAGERILIMRGLGGRNHLGDELSARGARVDYCELYQRQLPLEAAHQLEAALLSDTDELDIAKKLVVLQSGETLNNLVTSLQQVFEDHNQYRALTLLVPSERVRDEAAQFGFTQVYLAANATEAAMQQRLKEIKELWASL